MPDAAQRLLNAYDVDEDLPEVLRDAHALASSSVALAFERCFRPRLVATPQGHVTAAEAFKRHFGPEHGVDFPLRTRYRYPPRAPTRRRATQVLTLTAYSRRNIAVVTTETGMTATLALLQSPSTAMRLAR